jgi:pyridinium-3,5-bisthiocarboxylic acid mononucleotide nickel chelatase
MPAFAGMDTKHYFRGKDNMTNIAYFDCFSGCSGDMILGSLLDAGLELKKLREGLAGLNINGYSLTADKVLRSSISATHFRVIMDPRIEQHHRSLKDILEIINGSHLSATVKDKSSAIFRRLAEVEAGIHGVSLDQVHFHELGAVDTIIDIVGTIFALELLQIERIHASSLPVGGGSVTTDHGLLPVPAPATLQLLAAAKAPVVPFPGTTAPGELVTPTGAVLLTSLAVFKLPEMKISRVGYGTGSKDFKNWPNVLRLWLGEETATEEKGELVLLETNIDDMNPQVYGYLMDRLLAAKAADVWFTPIQMKKNRPAVMLSVLGEAALEVKFTEIIMQETTTLGIRARKVARHVAQREIIEFESSLGHTRAKVKRWGAGFMSVSPEYEDCRRIAMEKGLPLLEVSRLIETEARQYLSRIEPP